MSFAGADFLSRVAAKAIGDTPFVAPRLPALFERDAGPPGSGRDESVETEEEVESDWSASSLRTILSPPAQPAPQPAPEPAPADVPAAKRPMRAKAAPAPIEPAAAPTPLKAPAAIAPPVRPQPPADAPAAGRPMRAPAAPAPIEPAAPASREAPPAAAPPARPPAAAEPLAAVGRSPAASLLPPPPTADWPSPDPPPRRAADHSPVLVPPPADARLPRSAAEPKAEPRAASAPAMPQPARAPANAEARPRDVAPPIPKADQRDPGTAPQALARAIVPAAALQPSPSMATPVIVHAPEILRRADRRERSPAEAAAPATINITIARVDIRAHAAPAAPPKPVRARAEPQGLSAYLGQRKGGR